MKSKQQWYSFGDTLLLILSEKCKFVYPCIRRDCNWSALGEMQKRYHDLDFCLFIEMKFLPIIAGTKAHFYTKSGLLHKVSLIFGETCSYS